MQEAILQSLIYAVIGIIVVLVCVLVKECMELYRMIQIERKRQKKNANKNGKV